MQLAQRIARLAATRIFSPLSHRRLRKLARLSEARTFAAGETILQEGGVGLGLFVITHGHVQVFRSGADEQVIADLSDGDLLGEMALVDDLPRSASARAVERTECLLITREGFRSLTRKDPEIAWCIVPTLSERLREAQHDLRHNSKSVAKSEDAGPAVHPALPPTTANGRSRWSVASARLVRSTFALGLATARGMVGGGSIGESFLNNLSQQLEIGNRSSLDELAGRLPAGLATAGRRALVAALELPGEMVARAESVLGESRRTVRKS